MAQVELLSSADTLVVFDTGKRTVTFRDNRKWENTIKITLADLMKITHTAAGQLSAMAEKTEELEAALYIVGATPQGVINQAKELKAEGKLA